MPSKRTGPHHKYAEFGFTPEEAPVCLRCGADFEGSLQKSGYGLIYHVVPVSDYCPVAGLVARCKACEPWVSFDAIRTGKQFVVGRTIDWKTLERVNEYKSWHPPAMIQPVRGVRMYVLRRGVLEDDRLARCLARTWNRLPGEVRRTLSARWRSRREPGLAHYEEWGEWDPFCDGGLRVEALARWPHHSSMPLASCLNQGHAIRVNARYAKPMPDPVLGVLLAQELGHCYQFATSKTPYLGSDCETEVISLMAGWGFEKQDIYTWYDGYARDRWCRKQFVASK